jgi:hypothetical protein
LPDGSDSRASIGDRFGSSGAESSTETAMGLVSSPGTGGVGSRGPGVSSGISDVELSVETILRSASSVGAVGVGSRGPGVSTGGSGAW